LLYLYLCNEKERVSGFNRNIEFFIVKSKIIDIQHDITKNNSENAQADCLYAEGSYADCEFADHHYAECRG
jgi:hypothetical protein